MLSIIKQYRKVESPVFLLILAEFFIQFINAAFMAIQPLYMQSKGFTDGQSADFISYRFLGVLLFAVPLGLFIKGRKLKNIFYIACIGVPLSALLIVVAIDRHIFWLLYASQFFWGISFTFMQIPVLPYILRNAKKGSHTEAIALSYSTWSFAGILSGFSIALLNGINPVLFNEKVILLLISLIGFCSIYFISKIRINEEVPLMEGKRRDIKNFDWIIIVKSLFPTLIIAVGAGLTIPFISLFFANVHGMSTANFAFLNSSASVLVAIAAMSVPKIKKEIGYKIAIPTTQSFAVIALVLLATTQYYSQLSIAVYIAVICFMLRQPLMNMAGPMTSEMVMNYVGKRNQEMVSALTSAIWSGSWFISSRIFMHLRDSGFAYVNVFLITAALYGIGVVWYYFLILDYNKREKMGLISD